MSELYVVSIRPEKPKRSLIERASSREAKNVDEYLRRRFGARAFSLEANRISEFRGDLAVEADACGCVAGIYRGVKQVIICNQSPHQSRSLFGVIEPEIIPVAMFSTAGDYDLDISDELRMAMEDNDTSILSYSPHVGVRLDEPVVFNSLVNNSICEDDDEEVRLVRSPPDLHVVL